MNKNIRITRMMTPILTSCRQAPAMTAAFSPCLPFNLLIGKAAEEVESFLRRTGMTYHATGYTQSREM